MGNVLWQSLEGYRFGFHKSRAIIVKKAEYSLRTDFAAPLMPQPMEQSKGMDGDWLYLSGWMRRSAIGTIYWRLFVVPQSTTMGPSKWGTLRQAGKGKSK